MIRFTGWGATWTKVQVYPYCANDAYGRLTLLEYSTAQPSTVALVGNV